ncbi:MAG: NifB/NifX family molybdenum-iron cluster-binding protein [Planctomycetota bacterium]|jgi:predicted Fe-Mo cluster-binding NifX family protein
MKIAVTSTGPTLDDNVSTEFDHSRYLLIVDFDTLEFETMISPIVVDSSPTVGDLFTQQLLQADVSMILTSHISFNVLRSFLNSLRGTGIQIIDGMNGSVRSAIRQFKEICMAETVVIPSKDILN